MCARRSGEPANSAIASANPVTPSGSSVRAASPATSGRDEDVVVITGAPQLIASATG